MIGLLDPTTAIAIAIGLTSVIAMGLVAAAVLSNNTARRFQRRLNAVTNRKPVSTQSGGAAARSLTRRESATPGIDRIFRLLPRREVLVERLSRTGREISVGQYMIVTLGTILAMAVLCFIFSGLGLVPSLMF